MGCTAFLSEAETQHSIALLLLETSVPERRQDLGRVALIAPEFLSHTWQLKVALSLQGKPQGPEEATGVQHPPLVFVTSMGAAPQHIAYNTLNQEPLRKSSSSRPQLSGASKSPV